MNILYIPAVKLDRGLRPRTRLVECLRCGDITEKNSYQRYAHCPTCDRPMLIMYEWEMKENRSQIELARSQRKSHDARI